MDTEDAAAVVSTMGNLAGLAAVYSGGQPGAALNYYANSQTLWGGKLKYSCRWRRYVAFSGEYRSQVFTGLDFCFAKATEGT